ncbi:MAG: hypothetical protein ACREA0_17075 [bacterium]
MLQAIACLGTMVVTGGLYRHMAVRPETQDKDRRIPVAQTKMSEHRNDQ